MVRKVYRIDASKMFCRESLLGEIDDDGNFRDADGMLVGRFSEEGEFKIADGLWSEKTLFAVSSDGTVRDRLDSPFDPFTPRPLYFGRISRTGEIYDQRGNLIARVAAENPYEVKPDSSEYVKPKRNNSADVPMIAPPAGGSAFGCLAFVLLVLFAIFFIFGGFFFLPGVLASSHYTDTTRLVFTVSGLAGCVVAMVVEVRSILRTGKRGGFGEMFIQMVGISTTIASLLLFFGMGLTEGFGADAFEFLVGVFGCIVLSLVMCCVPCLFASIVISLVVRK